jgi:hypothetical protein
MTKQATVFVALSTKNVIANVLPILELAQPENGDQVLWIESATAKKSNWSTGALEVLRRHGMTAITPLEVSDDPASLQQALAAHDLVKNGTHIVKLIANGGTKLQMLAASKALNGHLDELLYNSDSQCVVEHDRYGQPVQSVPYQNHHVTLADMLECNNREIVPGTERCIWPTAQVPELPRYGTDVEYTRDCHQRIAAWIAEHPDNPKKAFAYEKAAELAPEQHDKLIAQVKKACALACNSKFEIRKDDLKDLYNCVYKLDREAWDHVGDDEAPNIGRELEDAVAVRVFHWLETNPELAKIVQSAWCNVKVRQRGSKEDALELDTALLLKNGILLHLECKSFDAHIKDMNSRLGELQRSFSQLARIAICAPSYPAFERDDWYKKYDGNVALMKKWKQFKFVEFTLPDQPGAEGITFEQALENWLKQYLPPVS